MAQFTAGAKEWKKYTVPLTADRSDDSCSVAIISKSIGKLRSTRSHHFLKILSKKEVNGLRADLAQTIADIRPKFMRFPCGCMLHGDGLGIMYRWKNTIGPVEERVGQKTLGTTTKRRGLGFLNISGFAKTSGRSRCISLLQG